MKMKPCRAWPEAVLMRRPPRRVYASPDRLLTAEKHALRVDGHHLVPFRLSHRLDSCDGDDAGVLNRDVDGAERLLRGVVERRDVRFFVTSAICAMAFPPAARYRRRPLAGRLVG